MNWWPLHTEDGWHAKVSSEVACTVQSSDTSLYCTENKRNVDVQSLMTNFLDSDGDISDGTPKWHPHCPTLLALVFFILNSSEHQSITTVKAQNAAIIHHPCTLSAECCIHPGTWPLKHVGVALLIRAGHHTVGTDDVFIYFMTTHPCEDTIDKNTSTIPRSSTSGT